MGLAEAERERGRKERRLLLLRRELGRRCNLAAHDPGELLAVGVDEAGLADARRIKLLQVAQVVGDLGDVTALAAHLLRPRPRLGEHVRERRRVGREQHDRSRPCEIVVQRAAVLVGLRDQCALEL